ncbi:group I truncated hemoglobin [Nocardia thailandica]|uniref:group I truncated hemoglobin n=1 Tax=Nocardia thailandica TaxID=257275 RepID=UPI00031BF919|nr:group 1 truncated hemoglobin [Nocardia thailandica]
MSSIYDRLGGHDTLHRLVTDHYRRLFTDPLLADYFSAANPNRLVEAQVRFLGQALGGPEVYAGEPLRAAHAGLSITRADFERVAAHLADALHAAGIPAATAGEVLDALAPLSGEIVETD